MNNKIKIIFNEEKDSLGYLILNDKFEWVSVSATSKLSRHEYTDIKIEENSKKILDYISEIYAPGQDDVIEIILEGFPFECKKFIEEAANYENVNVNSKDINVLVCGKIKSGKSTLIQTITSVSNPEVKEYYELYKSNNISWFEITGLDIEEGSYEKVINDIEKVLKENEISTVVYCISFEGHRFEKAEEELLKYVQNKLPEARIVVAITKAIDKINCMNWAKEIMENNDRLIATPVLAKSMKTRLGVIPADGLQTISNYIFEGI